jgi:beta-lactamase superfamily II metal-dependent hydrolase
MAALAVPSLTILDVGHGSCAILAEATRIVVFDAGPKTGLLEFLLQHQIDTIDLVMISHADRDHIEGLIAIWHECHRREDGPPQHGFAEGQRYLE